MTDAMNLVRRRALFTVVGTCVILAPAATAQNSADTNQQLSAANAQRAYDAPGPHVDDGAPARRLTGSSSIALDSDGAKRAVTVADAIRMVRGPRLTPAAHFSTDAGKFVVVVRRGNLERNTNESSLLLWQTRDVLRSGRPEIVLTMSSSSNRDAIDDDITWLDDNETLVFLGEHPAELRQLYTFNVRTRALKRITNHPANILSYSISANGERVVYLAEKVAESIFDDRTAREGFVVSTQWLLDLILARKGGYGADDDPQLFVQRSGRRWPIVVPGRIQWWEKPRISPNGRYATIPTRVPVVPDHWKDYGEKKSTNYADVRIRESIATKAAPGQYSDLERYVLIDLTNRSSRILLDSPLGWFGSEAAWAPDSRSIVLSNVYVPSDNTVGEEREARQSKPFTVEVALASGEITRITDEDLKLVEWNAATRLLRFSVGRHVRKPGPGIVFRKAGNTWEKIGNAGGQNGPEIVLAEDMNTPPKIVAVDPITQQQVLLVDLNPQFRHLRFAKEEEIQWQGTDGQQVKGGIYYPVDYLPGQRYPLVIQTHGFDAGVFWMDGPFTTAFAAQALAGKDMLVVQAEERFDDLNTPREVGRNVAAFEGLIDYLDEKGLIDRSRVGIIGFSRTCLHVKYALTHSKYHFAAASVTDGFDAGYLQYMLTANFFYGDNVSDRINGGPPFGDGLRSWIERSPTFGIAKVETPVRITALNQGSLLSEWEWFAALTKLGKPVDMILMQDGVHELQRPWDRMVSLQGNVDWFRFWLQGEEDSDPAKREQYARWRVLRKLQEQPRITPDPGTAEPGSR